MSCPTLEIDNLVVAPQTLLRFTQDYSELLAREFRRTADNSGILRTTGQNKIRTVINSLGWIPSALTTLELRTTHVMKCAMIRSADSDTSTVTVPAGRRSDIEPLGFAVVNDLAVSTPITNIADILAGTTDDATLTPVAGATAYRVHYWPQITVVVLSNDSDGDESGEFNWTLEAEEI